MACVGGLLCSGRRTVCVRFGIRRGYGVCPLVCVILKPTSAIPYASWADAYKFWAFAGESVFSQCADGKAQQIGGLALWDKALPSVRFFCHFMVSKKFGPICFHQLIIRHFGQTILVTLQGQFHRENPDETGIVSSVTARMC